LQHRYAILRVLLLKRFVRFNIEPHSPQQLIDPTKPVCYVLARDSLSDKILVDLACQQLHLPRALVPMKPDRINEKRAIFSLIKKNDEASSDTNWLHRSYKQLIKKLWPSASKAKRTKNPVDKLLRHHTSHPQDEIQIVPVAVYWGREPDVADQTSFWKLAFSDTWSEPGAIRKLIMILLHGRSTLLHFSAPIQLQHLKEEEPLHHRAVKKLTRILRHHFRQQRERVVGPDLSHRRTITNQIIHSQGVRHAIADTVRLGEMPYRIALSKAQKYADEIAADYSYAVIRSLHVILKRLWHKLYDGVEIYHIEPIKALAEQYELIYVPCHRSHIDYLLLSFVVYQHGLVPPHIAAGINLNIPVVGKILRRGGAFFMRRSFKENKIYSAVFNEYLHIMLKKGFSVEYFIEGGRSRTGRLLPPKLGMLSMTIQSYLRNATKPICFVPVYIGYEKLLEGDSFLDELKGRKKQQERLVDFFRSLNKLRHNHGKVYVNFGKPIFLDDHLSAHQTEWRETPTVTIEPSTPWVKKSVESLGHKIIHRLNQATVVNPINLVAIIMLTSQNRTMDEASLIRHLNLFIQLINQNPFHKQSILAPFSAHEALEQTEKLKHLERHHHPLGDLLHLKRRQSSSLLYFANNIVQHFILPALIANYAAHEYTFERNSVINFINELYPYIAKELYLSWDEEPLKKAINNWIDSFVQHNLLKALDSENAGFATPLQTSNHYLQLITLSKIAEPILERYAIILAVLLANPESTMSESELSEKAQLVSERVNFLFGFTASQTFDKAIFKKFLSTLKERTLILENLEKKITIQSGTESLLTITKNVLHPELRQVIEQIGTHLGEENH
jgi:glycerol-3-phosphate O-acyltransferase